MLYSNNDVILQSEEGIKKGQNIAVILNVWPLGMFGTDAARETKRNSALHLMDDRRSTGEAGGGGSIAWRSMSASSQPFFLWQATLEQRRRGEEEEDIISPYVPLLLPSQIEGMDHRPKTLVTQHIIHTLNHIGSSLCWVKVLQGVPNLESHDFSCLNSS